VSRHNVSMKAQLLNCAALLPERKRQSAVLTVVTLAMLITSLSCLGSQTTTLPRVDARTSGSQLPVLHSVNAAVGPRLSLHTMMANRPALVTYRPTLDNIPVVQGGQNTDVFTFKAQGLPTGIISLSISGLPKGVTSSWSANPVALSSGVGSSSLTLAASKNVAVNSYKFTVRASGANFSIYTDYTVKVTNPPGVQFKDWIPSLSMHSMDTESFDIEAIPLGGVTIPGQGKGATASIVSGLPQGISPSWSVPRMTSSGKVMWTLTLTGSADAVDSTGNLLLMVSITDAATANVYTSTLGVPLYIKLVPPTLRMSPVLTHVPVKQGESATDQFTFVAGGSYHGQLALAVSGLPTGVTGTWSSPELPISAGAGSSTLMLTASASAVVNWFHFTVTASGDGLTISTVYTVEVEPIIGFRMALSNTAVNIKPNESTTLVVTASPIKGVIIPAQAAGATASISSALPVGVSASWGMPTVTTTGAAQWVLRLTADASLKPSSDPVQLTVQVTDLTSGTIYTLSTPFTILSSLLADVSVGSMPGVTIPSDYIGLSHEWGNAEALAGTASTGKNLPYRQLLRNLLQYSTLPMIVRIGGNSTDTTTLLHQSSLDSINQLDSDVDGRLKFILGINMAASSPSIATAEMELISANIAPSIVEGLELGNEPDGYVAKGLRPVGYTFADYTSQLSAWNRLVASSSRMAPVSPALAGAGGEWLNSYESMLGSSENVATVITQHYYAGEYQATQPLPADFLLADQSAVSGPNKLEAYIAAAHAAAKQIRIGELNSLSNGGQPGVSNSFSSALWGIDTMFEFAQAGADGVNWHTGNGGPYDLFEFRLTGQPLTGVKDYSLTQVRPLFYGLQLFAEASTAHGALLPVTLETQANLKTWAVQGVDGHTRIVIINKDEKYTGAVRVNVPGFTSATISRLLAPSLSSLSGVTLGGQTYDGSPDGTLQGQQSLEYIQATDGSFTLTMPVVSAALLTLSK
jgi:hypothetical protein